MVDYSKKSILLALIKEAEAEFSSTGRPVLDIEEYVAETLLEKGVEVPLVNIGDKLWTDVGEDEICVDTVEVVGLDKTAEGTTVRMKYGTMCFSCDESQLEKQGFLFTEKEAVSYYKI